uniref:Uncharacterized protein n=1 Tax=Salix viminalis TaxID=40686 RepID=A0A6N2M4F4_SALVM
MSKLGIPRNQLRFHDHRHHQMVTFSCLQSIIMNKGGKLVPATSLSNSNSITKINIQNDSENTI